MKSESPNLHRHPKKTKNKPLDAPNLHRRKKNKKNPGTMGALLSSCGIFFFWCLSMFGASSGIGACQCFVKSESPNLHRHQKNEKKQTTRCTKPAQVPNKQKKRTTIPGTMGPLLSSCWKFFFLWCLSMFGASSGLFLFFWCLSMFLYISCQDHDEKSAMY